MRRFFRKLKNRKCVNQLRRLLLANVTVSLVGGTHSIKKLSIKTKLLGFKEVDMF